MKNNNHKGFAILPLLFIIVAVAVAAGIGYAISTQTDLFLSKSDNTNIVACTEEAKLCPDGSYVGRTGPNCAFADCPSTNTNVAVNTNTSANTNTVVDAMADWKTYENTTIGYTVKYSPTWKVSSCEGSTAVSFGLQGLKCGSDAPSEDFGIAEIIDSISVSSRVASLKAAMVSPIESQVTVSGIQGTRIAGVHKKDLDTLRGGGQYSDDIFFMRNGKTYRLGYFILGGEKKYVSEFDGFYKTFTFTDPTASWKTYTSATYGYSLKYPPTFTLSGTDEAKKIDIADYPAGNVQHFAIYEATGSNDAVFGDSGNGLAIIDWINNARAGFPDTKYLSNRRTTVIGGKTFVTFDYDLGGSGGSVQYYFVQGKKVLIIHDWPGGAGNKDYNPLRSDRILSTFTFTK